MSCSTALRMSRPLSTIGSYHPGCFVGRVGARPLGGPLWFSRRSRLPVSRSMDLSTSLVDDGGRQLAVGEESMA